MALTITHAKTNNIADWTQADLDAQIALGNYPPGTLLADIVIPSDWNADHTLAGSVNIGGVAFDGLTDITPQQISAASETSDNTCFPLFLNSASGAAQQPKYRSTFSYNAGTNALTAATFIGALTGEAATVNTINGKISAGTNISLSGSGTTASPYVINSSGGGVNTATAEVDFGFQSGQENNLTSVTVAAAWVTASSVITCSPIATATDDHDPDDYALEGIKAYATNIVDGVGFDIIASADYATFGKYNINAIGV